MSFFRRVKVNLVASVSKDLQGKLKAGDWNDDIEAAFKKGIEDFKATGSW